MAWRFPEAFAIFSHGNDAEAGGPRRDVCLLQIAFTISPYFSLTTKPLPLEHTRILREPLIYCCDTADDLTTRSDSLDGSTLSTTAAMGGFGDFSSICTKTPLPLCPLVGPKSPITGSHYTMANCYSRAVIVANTIIFQGATGFAHILALIMTVIMIIHVRSKFTAVGEYTGRCNERRGCLR